MILPNPTLLMTRPRAASERFTLQLSPELLDRLAICHSPLIRIDPVADSIEFGKARGLVFTSTNGVNIASNLTKLRELRVFCVGMATTRAARDHGWHADEFGQTAQQLVANLRKADVKGPLLHLCGTHHRGDVAERLTAAGYPTARQVIYDQALQPLSESARTLIVEKSRIIAPLFSPRTARHFVHQCPEDAQIHLIALSAAVAQPLYGLTNSSVTISDRPTADDMIAEVETTVNRLYRVESVRGSQ